MGEDIILITGATRGLGRGTALALAKRGHHIVVTGRDLKKAREVQDEIISQGGGADALQLDVTNTEDIAHAITFLYEKFGHLDVLINNAGILNEGDYTVFDIPSSVMLETFGHNTLGTLNMIQGTISLLEHSSNPRVVNISSGMGALAEMGGGFPAYRISKAGVNILTILFHNELNHTKGFIVNSVCPGWVQTEMGGEQAPRTIEEGVVGIVWAAELEKGSPSGLFFRDGQKIAW